MTQFQFYKKFQVSLPIYLLAPAVTNMLGAFRSLIGTMKWQLGVIVENPLRHDSNTTRFLPPSGREPHLIFNLLNFCHPHLSSVPQNYS